MRLIDADKLKNIISDTWILDRIDEQPTVDLVKHGHWESEYGTHYCSKCKNYIAHEPTFYCPNCGAKMDEIVDGYKYDFKTQTYVYIQSP